MGCPRCGAALSGRADSAVVACPGCAGRWIPEAFLYSFLRACLSRSGLPDRPLSLLEMPSVPTDLRCPQCPGSALERVTLRAVEVARCPACRGVFVDPGGLGVLALRVLRSARQFEAMASPRQAAIRPRRVIRTLS